MEGLTWGVSTARIFNLFCNVGCPTWGLPPVCRFQICDLVPRLTFLVGVPWGRAPPPPGHGCADLSFAVAVDATAVDAVAVARTANNNRRPAPGTANQPGRCAALEFLISRSPGTSVGLPAPGSGQCEGTSAARGSLQWQPPASEVCSYSVHDPPLNVRGKIYVSQNDITLANLYNENNNTNNEK